MKAQGPFRKTIVATWLAIDVEEGKLTSLKTEDAKDYIKEHYAQFVTFSAEET